MRVFSSMLSLLIVIGIGVAALVSETVSNVDEQLIERGFPEYLLSTMDLQAKKDMVDHNEFFAGAAFRFHDEDTNTVTEINIDQDGVHSSGPFEQIPSADLSMGLIFSTRKKPNGNLEHITITFQYNWKKLPLFRYQDPISISWDSSRFSYKSGSFSKVDYWDGYLPGGDFETGNMKSSENYYANGSTAGITWYADLVGHLGASATKLYGNGSLKITPKFTGSSGSERIWAHYVHAKSTASYSVRIPFAGSFIVSGGSNYDSLGMDKYATWY